MHTSVLLKELTDFIAINPAGIYVDCTGGGGGHSAALMERCEGNARLLVLDRDIEAVERLKGRFASDKRIIVIHKNFADINVALAEAGINEADGIFADFGVSNFQLVSAERGFSFRRDGPLDMRMDNTSGEPVSVVVNTLTEDNLVMVIKKFGEEKFAGKIAFEIVKRRAIKSFETTADLAETIKKAVPKKFHKKRIHPATQTFQALRIFVNKELEAVDFLTQTAFSFLKPGGRFAAISFHSLEDRIVKENFNKLAQTCVCPKGFPVCVCGVKPVCKILTKKPIIPNLEEIDNNPLSRSAKMRVVEKI